MLLVTFPRWTRSPMVFWLVSEIVASSARAGIILLYSALVRPYLKCSVQFEPLLTRKTLRCWTMSREGPKTLRSGAQVLGGVTEGVVRRRLREDLITLYNNLKKGCREASVNLLSQATSNKTRRNGFKLQKRRF